MKVRRTRIGISVVEAKPRWNDSTLVFEDYSGKDKREVIITITEPYEIIYLQERLKEIASYWKDCIKRMEQP